MMEPCDVVATNVPYPPMEEMVSMMIGLLSPTRVTSQSLKVADSKLIAPWLLRMFTLLSRPTPPDTHVAIAFAKNTSPLPLDSDTPFVTPSKNVSESGYTWMFATLMDPCLELILTPLNFVFGYDGVMSKSTP